MKRLTALIFTLFLTQTIAQGTTVLPRKNNIVSNFLNQTLNSLFDELAKGIFIPEIDLEDIGRFADVEVSAVGEMKKQVDGFKTFGFNLNTTFSKIIVSGYYDILHLDIPELFPVFGKGNFSIVLETINLNMRLSADYSAIEEKFLIAVPNFDLFVENSTVKFENLMNDPFVADFLNQLISNLIPDLITVFAKPLIDYIQPVIEIYGNGIINCIKKELITGKVKECIQNFFEGASVKVDEKLFFSQMGTNMNLF